MSPCSGPTLFHSAILKPFPFLKLKSYCPGLLLTDFFPLPAKYVFPFLARQRPSSYVIFVNSFVTPTGQFLLLCPLMLPLALCPEIKAVPWPVPPTLFLGSALDVGHGSANWSPQVKSACRLFLEIRSRWQTNMPICLCTVSGCLLVRCNSYRQ